MVDKVGQLVHTVPHTLRFTPPLFRLAIVDAQGTITTTKALLIPYRPPLSDGRIFRILRRCWNF
jgi:hypothetical protein